MKKTTKLQILHTSDMHGYVYPYSYSTKESKDIGVAKLATLINNLRDDNTLLIDSGDTIQGSPLTYYHSKERMNEINPMALVVNHLNYDYITIGNHEFNYGKTYIKNYLNHVDATILNCNLLDSNTKEPMNGITHEIRELEHGLKVGIIGVTTHYIPNWEQPSHIEGLEIVDAFESTKKLVNDIKDKCDFIIVNYHGGFERDFDTFELTGDDTGENQGSKMLKELDGIDLLLTGHQHRMLNGELFGTHYSQPGFNAQMLSRINIEFTYENDKWSYQVLENKLYNTKDVDPDKTVMELIQEEETMCQEFLDTSIGKMKEDLLITDQLESRLNKHPLVSLINHVQREYTKADISCCSLGNDVSGFKKDISIRDVIGTYIFPNTLVVKELSGKVLKQAIEKTAEFFSVKDNNFVISDEFNSPKLQLYAYDMYDGIEYTLDISKPKGERITSLTKDGSPIKDSDVFSVVMNNYRSSGGGDYYFIKDCKILNDTQTEVIELLMNYILKNKEIIIPHTDNITIVK